MERILLELIKRLTRYSIYSGYWDGGIDIYQGHLSKLRTVATPIPMQKNSEKATSESINAEIPLRSAVQKQKPKNWEQLIATHIDTWLDQAPVDALDSTAVTAWIKTNIANFAVLDVRDVQIISPYLKDMATNYVKGLPEPERVLLNRNNPA